MFDNCGFTEFFLFVFLMNSDMNGPKAAKVQDSECLWYLECVTLAIARFVQKIFLNIVVLLNLLSYHVAKKVSGTTNLQTNTRLLVRFDTQ